MSALFSLADKAALITGGTRGIGLAIAREYGRPGARLVISSESLDDRDHTVATLAEEGIYTLALLLAAPGGAFITGQNLIVDGGTTIGDGN